MLQALADVALELCQAHSAGISILEHADGRDFFRWHAVSGQWRAMQWNTLPREFSPCGTVLDRAAAQLMISPERYFTPMLQISPKVAEVLLVPFEVAGEMVGTVWVIAHDICAASTAKTIASYRSLPVSPLRPTKGCNLSTRRA